MRLYHCEIQSMNWPVHLITSLTLFSCLCMSKSCPQPAFIGYKSGGSCPGGKGDKVNPSGTLLPLVSALEHSACLHRHVSEQRESSSSATGLTSHSLTAGRGHLWPVPFWPLQPTAGLLPMGPCPLACRECQPRSRGPAEALLLCVRSYL